MFAIFREMFDDLVSFSKFSDVFGPIWMRSDLLGRVRTHSDAFRSVWTLSEKIENFGIFESVFDVFGCNFTKNFRPSTVEKQESQLGCEKLNDRILEAAEGHFRSDGKFVRVECFVPFQCSVRVKCFVRFECFVRVQVLCSIECFVRVFGDLRSLET